MNKIKDIHVNQTFNGTSVTLAPAGVQGIERGLAAYTVFANIGEYVLKDNIIRMLESSEDGRFILSLYRLGNTLLSVVTLNYDRDPLELEHIIDQMSLALDLENRIGKSFKMNFQLSTNI